MLPFGNINAGPRRLKRWHANYHQVGSSWYIADPCQLLRLYELDSLTSRAPENALRFRPRLHTVAHVSEPP